MLDFLGNLERTHKCGELRVEQAGQDVVLMGWVNRRRDHGNLIFLDVRDRTGITQVVLDKELSGEAHAKAEAARSEYVVAVKGTVRKRDEGLSNPNMATGEIEVVAKELLLLNESKTPPFSPAEDAIGNEEVRLKYRYLDLRRPQMQHNFELRHKVAQAIRGYLSDNGFLEIETPFMTRSTPEGARDYLVPSRVHAGSFYALPQSPQIFKQILMISGFDRYFQIARCFRDEDLRADRQPEFTQIDLEMTFPKQETVFRVVEGFLTAAFKTAGISLTTPFIQMTYDEAIRRYGIDKPDMRLPAMFNLSAELTGELREKLKIEQDLPILGFVIPNSAATSSTRRKSLIEEIRKHLGDSGLDFLDIDRLGRVPEFSPLAEAILTRANDSLYDFLGSTARAVHEENQKKHLAGRMIDNSHLVIVITPKLGTPRMWNFDRQWIHKRVGALRLEIAKKFADRHKLFEETVACSTQSSLWASDPAKMPEVDPEVAKRAFRFVWVTDFPMYEWDEEAKVWNAAHHPFTSPHEDDIKAGRLVNDKGAVRALAYDIVLNGTELGSGSIRIHRQDVQAEIFRSLGMTDAEAKERFGFFLDALEYGTPPHGGIALGLDRIVMILAGATSLREVIAFPKTAKAIDLMVDAPTPVSDQQMKELHLRTVVRS
jgi:aspartyl-tRNA synthetase